MGWLALLNIVIPQVTNVIVAIRHNNGSQSAVIYLDEADPLIAQNMQQVQDWLASKGKKPA